MIWYLTDPARLKAERSAIEALAAEADWLSGLHWTLGKSGRLVLRFTIAIGERRYDLIMTYPEFYPAAPPGVAPADAELRISPHQYGRGGDLCLEYRPDNWEVRFNGADLIRSAHKLISTENPAEGDGLAVRSAHAVTTGQELRSKTGRFLVTTDLAAFVGAMVEGLALRCETRLLFQPSSMSAVVSKVTLADGSDWNPTAIPDVGNVYRGLLVRTSSSKLKELIDDATGAAARQFRDALADAMTPALTAYADKEFIIAGDGAEVRLLWQMTANSDGISQLATVKIDDDRPRLPGTHGVLSAKKIAIIGCGSVGSKVATSLGRSGTGNFLLVDDDILVRKNLVRNDLDWRSMGEHKADALAARIHRVNPLAAAKARRFRLGGQEAPGSASSLLSEIGDCDLIVDATANPRVFNLLSAVAVASAKPMVWCEVFAGGIGGFIARHRPGKDHPPQTMRAALRAWFKEQNVPWEGTATDYDSEDSSGAPLIADDGDVSVMAAHTARMATDLLLGGGTFPNSMYVIGMKRGWIFEQPFEVYPVDCSGPLASIAPSESTEEELSEAARFVTDVLEGMQNEAVAAGQD